REREIWDGRRAGPEGARSKYGADASYTIDQLADILPRYLENAPSLYYTLGRYPEFDTAVQTAIDSVKAKGRQGIRAPRVFRDPAALLNDMRLKKTAAELDIMRRAAAISSDAHRAAMEALHPGMHEYEIEALIEY